MNNEIKLFNHEQFGQIRICIVNDKEWFCLSDVCKALEIGNPSQLKARLQQRGLITNDTPTYNQHGTMVIQKMTYIDEANLYRCIFQSRKQEAEQFQSWVFEVVLPQIRRTGGYIPVKEDDTPEELMARALLVAKETIEKKDAIIAQKNAQLVAQRPKVMFADAVTSQEDSILISEMAKLLTQNGYEIGRTRFFRWLRENGYLFKHSTEPIQKWVEKGIFDTHVTIINTNHGQRESITTKVTGKGQQYFINLFIR